MMDIIMSHLSHLSRLIRDWISLACSNDGHSQRIACSVLCEDGFMANRYVSVQDGGYPPLKNQSVLTVLLEDSDDQGPAFQYNDYTATVIGEKPVMVRAIKRILCPEFKTWN